MLPSCNIWPANRFLFTCWHGHYVLCVVIVVLWVQLGKGQRFLFGLIVFGLTGNSYFQIGACVARRWVLSQKMQQNYLLFSPLSVLFLSPWQNSNSSVNEGDLNCWVVFVCLRSCYRTITVIVPCIHQIAAVQCAGSQLCVQHVFKGIPASEHNRRKGPDPQQPWFQPSLSNVTRGLIKLGKCCVMYRDTWLHRHTPWTREIIMHLTLTEKSSGFPTEDTFQSNSSKGNSSLRFKYSLSAFPIQFSEICLSGTERSRDAITLTTYYCCLGIFHFVEGKGRKRRC